MDRISEIPEKLNCLWKAAAQEEGWSGASMSQMECEALAKRRAYAERMKKTEIKLFFRQSFSFIIRFFLLGMILMMVIFMVLLAIV
ncbi:MAG: hypothetical protein IJU50_02525 [Lachnospiraceae bacterium]|nr:hypothetical protein [Lachnospiraceae bacterium]